MGVFKCVPKGICHITLAHNVPDILLPHSHWAGW